jgi:hypothetical protein
MPQRQFSSPHLNCANIFLPLGSRLQKLSLPRLRTILFNNLCLWGSPVAPKSESKASAAKPRKEDAKIEGASLIGIDVRKELDFPNWYQQVLTKGDMVFLF